MAAHTNRINFRICAFSFLISIGLYNIYFEVAVFIMILLWTSITVTLFTKLLRPASTALCIISSVFGFWLAHTHWESHKQNEYKLQQSAAQGQKEIQIKVRIKRLTKISKYEKTYRAKMLQIGDIHFEDQKIHLLIAIPKNLTLQENQSLSLQAKITFPRNEKNQLFQYKTWLHMQSIYGLIRIRIPPKKENTKLPIISRLRTNWRIQMESVFPEKHTQFLAGILLGERRDLDEATCEHFIRSGLMHIIAVSGFNITILILFMQSLCVFFPRWLQISMTIGVIAFFVAIVGYQVPVVRAAILGSINFIALTGGKKIRTYHLLLASLIGFCIFNPISLTHDLSLMLSYLSVIGIIAFQEPIKKLFRHIPKTLELRDALIMTTASLVTTFPIGILYFGHFSLISPLANILVGAAIPPAMLFGFLASITNILSEACSYYLGWIGWAFLNYILKITEWSGSRSWSSITIEHSPIMYYIFWGYYLVLGVIILRKEVST